MLKQEAHHTQRRLQPQQREPNNLQTEVAKRELQDGKI